MRAGFSRAGAAGNVFNRYPVTIPGAGRGEGRFASAHHCDYCISVRLSYFNSRRRTVGAAVPL